jgi:alkylation response protein AidB-like acyl-CoA dehydrogenase
MHTSFSDEDLKFRDEVRAFMRDNFTPDLERRLACDKTFKDAQVEWEKKLYAQGWIAPNWPVEYGGTGWTITQKFIFESERSAAGAADVMPFGLKMLSSVILGFGSEEQKQRFLPKILSSDEWWCQGYSEPGAGSDLAALKTSAKLDNGEYVVNGHKIWTSYAHYADWIFCLVRTSKEAKKQQGISFLLIDINTPGITIKPIVSIDGRHTLNEVFFDDVRVPVENLIGEPGKGWTYAKALLTHERSMAGVADAKRDMRQIREWAKQEISGGKALIEDPMFRMRLTDVDIDLMALEFTELRTLAKAMKGQGPGTESSILKIKGTEIQQSIQELRMDLAGYYAGILPGELSTEETGHEFGSSAREKYMYGRAATLYGGSNEIQRGIIAKFVLGL